MVAMSAFTIVPDAPLESVIVTFFSLKSIGLSLIFDWSVSVPSRTNLLPAFSVARCSPAFVPSASVPSNNNLPTVSMSWKRLISIFSFSSCRKIPPTKLDVCPAKPSSVVLSNNIVPPKVVDSLISVTSSSSSGNRLPSPSSNSILAVSRLSS